MRYYSVLQWLKNKNPDNTKYWQESGGNSHSSLVKLQNGQVTLKHSLAVSYKAKYNLTTWSSDYPNELKSTFTQKHEHECL